MAGKLKKIDKLILVAIISALFSFLALNLARFGFRNYDVREVKYNEDSKINYQVYLKLRNIHLVMLKQRALIMQVM